MSVWPHFPFEELVQSRGSGASGLPQSEWAFDGRYPVIGQGAEDIEGWSDRDDLVIAPRPAVVLYGGHTRRAKYVDRPFVPGPNVKILESSAELDPKFLYHYLTQLKIESRGYADHFPEVRRRRIPLPPVAEQRRIAEILDKADALRAKRRAALAQLDTLTQSIFLDMFGDPATNPKGWPQVPIGDHASKIGSGATPRGGEESYKAAGITLIRSMNVRDGAFLRDGLAFIDDEQAAQLAGVVVEADDVLLNITGASVARVCRAPADVLPARVNQHVSIIRPTATFNPLFLEQCLLLPSVKEHLLKIARAGATREAITKSAIEHFSVIGPPHEVQDRFAARVAASERISGQMRVALGGADALFASLQHRAFRGEL